MKLLLPTLALLLHSALAGVVSSHICTRSLASFESFQYITAPVESTKASGGQQFSVVWDDDGNSPTIDQLGTGNISIMTGSDNDQTELQRLETNVPLSTTASTVDLIDSNIGPDGNVYFVRIISNDLKNDDGYPYSFYSANFLLENMDGKFNDDIKKQLQKMQQQQQQRKSTQDSNVNEGEEQVDEEDTSKGNSITSNYIIPSLAVLIGAMVSTH